MERERLRYRPVEVFVEEEVPDIVVVVAGLTWTAAMVVETATVIAAAAVIGDDEAWRGATNLVSCGTPASTPVYMAQGDGAHQPLG
ncbi:hypothetical protein [Oryza sativa Japonica Group]|uniref:Uncharacterized protein n=1 Tax=Oryza sativa subsp. japonica TaxID=39947 RepID=Q5ZDU4_ORYSJ|nr:hypothetical protein [Oryza sativa Japonica Group]